MKKKILSAVLACAATMSLATCAFADTPATNPGVTGNGDSDEVKDDVVVATVDLGSIDDKGLEGDKLNAKIFAGDLEGLTWKDVTAADFTSADNDFSVQFSVKAGAIDGDAEGIWFVMGENTLTKADGDRWGKGWTLGEAELKAIVAAEKPGDGFVKVTAEKDAPAKVSVKITATKAAKTDDNKPTGENKPTGIALAVAPAALAVAFVSVAAVMSKKKKG